MTKQGKVIRKFGPRNIFYPQTRRQISAHACVHHSSCTIPVALGRAQRIILYFYNLNLPDVCITTCICMSIAINGISARYWSFK